MPHNIRGAPEFWISVVPLSSRLSNPEREFITYWESYLPYICSDGEVCVRKNF